MEPSIIVTTIENHGKRITDLETRMTLNEERDSHRDKQIESNTKAIMQMNTSVNQMLDTLGGETGLIQSVRSTERNQNKAAGFLALIWLYFIS